VAERSFGRCEFAERKSGIAQTDIGIEVAAAEHESALEARGGFLTPLLGLQNDSEIEVGLGNPRRRIDGAAHPGFRLVQFSEAEAAPTSQEVEFGAFNAQGLRLDANGASFPATSHAEQR
jgi:hypothetical protein